MRILVFPKTLGSSVGDKTMAPGITPTQLSRPLPSCSLGVVPIRPIHLSAPHQDLEVWSPAKRITQARTSGGWRLSVLPEQKWDELPVRGHTVPKGSIAHPVLSHRGGREHVIRIDKSSEGRKMDFFLPSKRRLFHEMSHTRRGPD